MKRKVQWIMAVLLLMKSDWRSFCMGYSQGGAVSLATHREIEEQGLADNSVITGWEPKHRIQFFHSKTDVIVPYGNYLSFRDAHPQGEGTLFRINDTFSASDHMDAGAALLMEMLTLKSYGAYFNWLCEGSTTGIKTMEDGRWKMYGTP